MLDRYSLLGPRGETPEERCDRFRRLGCNYEPTAAEIQQRMEILKVDGYQQTERDWTRAVGDVMYLRFCEELKSRNDRHEKDLTWHYAERNAGREPLRPADLISVTDGAQRVGVEPQKIHFWIRNRDLRVWGIPKHYRVSLAELKMYAAVSENNDGLNNHPKT